MKTVYLAGRFSSHPILRLWAQDLTLGFDCDIVSRWILRAPTEVAVPSDLDRMKWAEEDLEDIRLADTFILRTGVKGGSNRGGRHSEFGYALKEGCALILIGPRENIFHYLPEVKSFSTWEAFLGSLRP